MMKITRLSFFLFALFPLFAFADEMILIPAGDFIRGTDQVDDKNRAAEFGAKKPFYLDEHPKVKIHVPAFYIDKYEVTNSQYRDFIKNTDRQAPTNWFETGYLFSMQKEKLDHAPEAILRKLAVSVLHVDMDTRKMSRTQLLSAVKTHYDDFGHLPVTFTTWHDAYAYCEWKGKRLPTENEWEKAARGNQGQIYTWGNKWLADAANTTEAEWTFGVAPVGSYPKDVSPYGVYDMAGNVSEWVDNWYQAYPESHMASDLFGKKYKVARGGGWSTSGHYALNYYYRASYRINLQPNMLFKDVGFRCAKSVEP